jgi:TPP-dependent pyruvate/acetoin dehydrogenase alpha subunit
MAEILGRATGLYGGRGGAIHLGDPDLGFISTSGIVGGCISLGVGAGYACCQLGQGAISAVFFGDGALEEGISFDALNIASLWRLPVLFICENNSIGSWAPGQGYPTLVHASSDLCNIAKSVNIATMRSMVPTFSLCTPSRQRPSRFAAPAKVRSFLRRSPSAGPAATRYGLNR